VSQQSDYYHTLGISPFADPDEIRRAYRTLAKQYHPDRVPIDRREWARTEMARINVAYEVLGDPLRRAEYDCEHGYGAAGQSQAAPAGASRWRTQRVRERSRRGQIERQRVATLAGAALLGVALVAALARFRLFGLETAVGRCAWAIVLAVGALLVIAAFRLTEL
jgi:curved DNA-binding protein CbpA